jgi:hypothetical protein
MEQLKFKSSRFWPLFSNLIYPANLELTDLIVLYTKKKLLCKPVSISFPIVDIAFFDTAGVIKKSIDFGYTDQIFMKGLSAVQCAQIKEHIIKNGAKVGHEGKAYKSLKVASFGDLFRPLRWFRPEIIVLTNEAVIFIKKKMFSNKTTYLPYNKISFGYLDGRFSKSIYMIGEQNIVSDYSFSKEAVKELEEQIKQKGIGLKNGKSIRPFWFSSARNLVNPPRIFYTENEVAYIDVLPLKEKVIKVLRYDEIATFRKAKWYSLIGSIIITGNINNIRRDQAAVEFSREIMDERAREKPVITDDEFVNNGIIILLKNVWFYRWRIMFFSVGLRSKIQKKAK